MLPISRHLLSYACCFMLVCIASATAQAEWITLPTSLIQYDGRGAYVTFGVRTIRGPDGKLTAVPDRVKAVEYEKSVYSLEDPDKAFCPGRAVTLMELTGVTPDKYQNLQTELISTGSNLFREVLGACVEQPEIAEYFLMIRCRGAISAQLVDSKEIPDPLARSGRSQAVMRSFRSQVSMKSGSCSFSLRRRSPDSNRGRARTIWKHNGRLPNQLGRVSGTHVRVGPAERSGIVSEREIPDTLRSAIERLLMDGLFEVRPRGSLTWDSKRPGKLSVNETSHASRQVVLVNHSPWTLTECKWRIRVGENQFTEIPDINLESGGTAEQKIDFDFRCTTDCQQPVYEVVSVQRKRIQHRE